MNAGKVKIVGFAREAPLTGKDIRVVLETPDGESWLIPAQSLVLKVGGRHELVVATVEVPAVLVDLQGVELEVQADVVPAGAESQWEESLGKQPGDRIADFERYANLSGSVHAAPVVGDPMAELDAAIAGKGP